MEETFNDIAYLQTLLREAPWWSLLLQWLLIGTVVYSVYRFLRGTRGARLLRGIAMLLVVSWLFVNFLPKEFAAIKVLYQQLVAVVAFAVIVIFQPELRRALEQLGRTGSYLRFLRKNEVSPVVVAVKDASIRLSQRRHGALIVFERDTGLQEYIDTGILLDAEVSPDLLLTIFNKNTELHDGAVIMRNDRLAAAACVMPLSTSSLSDRQMGLRHRAALGISEVSDAVAVVVSEETGQVSIAHNGRVIRRQDPSRLDDILHAFLHNRQSSKRPET